MNHSNSNCDSRRRIYRTTAWRRTKRGTAIWQKAILEDKSRTNMTTGTTPSLSNRLRLSPNEQAEAIRKETSQKRLNRLLLVEFEGLILVSVLLLILSFTSLVSSGHNSLSSLSSPQGRKEVPPVHFLGSKNAPYPIIHHSSLSPS